MSPMTPPIQLERFCLEPDSWQRFVFKLSLSRVMRVIIIAGAVFLGLALVDPHFIVPALVGMLMFVVLMPAALWSNCVKMVKNPLNRFTWSSRQVEFDDVMIRMASSEGTRSELPWRTIVKVTDHKDFYLLYVTATQFFPIPKTAFSQPGHENELRSILKGLSLLKDKPEKK